jgi:hypothetical protein
MMPGMPQAREELTTVSQVIEALGKGDKFKGRRKLLQLTGRQTQHVTNWLAFGKIPKVFYLPIQAALKRRYRVSPDLFGLEPARAKAS